MNNVKIIPIIIIVSNIIIVLLIIIIVFNSISVFNIFIAFNIIIVFNIYIAFNISEKLMINKCYTLKTSWFLLLIVMNTAAIASENNFLEKANVAFKENLYNEALVHLKNLTQKQPNNRAARLLMAEVLIASAKGAAAEVELNRAEKLGADKNRTLLLFAEAYLLQGKYNEVISEL